MRIDISTCPVRFRRSAADDDDGSLGHETHDGGTTSGSLMENKSPNEAGLGIAIGSVVSVIGVDSSATVFGLCSGARSGPTAVPCSGGPGDAFSGVAAG